MIVVFGSINIDLVTHVETIARPGETVLGPSYAVIPGGKGANQALAARRAGAAVALVGAVGRDGFADAALALLAADGVDLSCVARVDAPTGAAFISVDAAGQNAITVAAGANALAKAAQLERRGIGPGDILLLQRETPDAENLAAARFARANGARVVLNLAPAGPLSLDALACLDMLVMNEHEAAFLGAHLNLPDASPEGVAAALHSSHGLATIVTLGAAGAMGWSDGARHAHAAPKVEVVDTTAAGDSFAGAFACALDGGADFAGALRHGLAAGSLACTKAGAQTSIPHAAGIAAMFPALGRAAFPDC